MWKEQYSYWFSGSLLKWSIYFIGVSLGLKSSDIHYTICKPSRGRDRQASWWERQPNILQHMYFLSLKLTTWMLRIPII
jgi:hypothetical protein